MSTQNPYNLGNPAPWGPESIPQFLPAGSQAGGAGMQLSYREVRDAHLRGERLTPEQYASLSPKAKNRLNVMWSTGISGMTEAQHRELQYSGGHSVSHVRSRLQQRVAATPGRQSYSYNEIWTMPWRKASWELYQDIQRRLYAAGYMEEEPRYGDKTDQATLLAWNQAVSDYYAVGHEGSMEEFLEQRAAYGAEIGQTQLGAQIIELTDAAAIRGIADDLAQQVLGRKLTDEQKTGMVEYIHGLQTMSQEAAIGVADLDAIQEQGGIAGISGNITPDMVGRYGQMLAAQYGLQVTSHHRSMSQNAAVGGARNSDHLTGMAVDISGSPAQMDRLGRWARANEGPGKLFRWVGWKDNDPAGHSDHVHLSFNPVAGTGAMADIPSTGASSMGGGGGLAAFMAATRQVESGGNYGVTNSIGARGAYQFMPGTWSSAARQAGANPSDWSPQNQDRVASHLMQSYYQQFGDWRLVAAAWHGGPGTAMRAKTDPNYLSSIGDGNISTAGYVDKVMAAMGNPAMQDVGAGGVTVPIENVDAERRLEERLRELFPEEATSHDVALTFNDFSEIAFGGALGAEV